MEPGERGKNECLHTSQEPGGRDHLVVFARIVRHDVRAGLRDRSPHDGCRSVTAPDQRNRSAAARVTFGKTRTTATPVCISK